MEELRGRSQGKGKQQDWPNLLWDFGRKLNGVDIRNETMQGNVKQARLFISNVPKPTNRTLWNDTMEILALTGLYS